MYPWGTLELKLLFLVSCDVIISSQCLGAKWRLCYTEPPRQRLKMPSAKVFGTSLLLRGRGINDVFHSRPNHGSDMQYTATVNYWEESLHAGRESMMIENTVLRPWQKHVA